jgi:4-amino-4-deoxy-L-arabinose transferase-like glycosyltransferase
LLGRTAVFLLAAALRIWHLDQNGYGNEYYTAGVRSMMSGSHNLLYDSFDPAGFISVDKPPVALWIQVASVKLFGFHGLGILLPQVLEGVAAVALIYHLVRRRFGEGAGCSSTICDPSSASFPPRHGVEPRGPEGRGSIGDGHVHA